jgi:hypothetical protein
MTIDNYIEMFLSLTLNLADNSIGEYKLESAVYKKGSSLVVVPDNYQGFLAGHKPRSLTLQKDFRYYDLFKGNQRIMCSSPVIMYEQYLPFIKSKGKVLLGGLGLGIIPRLLCEKDIVSKVTVVELSKEVIELCAFENDKVEILNDDIYTFMQRENLNQFDYIYIDAYTSDTCAYEKIILPTRKFMQENYPTVTLDFWQEDQLKIEYLINNKKIFINNNVLK